MNILVFTKNWVGDVIFQTPAVRTIKENFPDARMIAVTTPRCVEVLKANPHVDEVITFDEKGKEKNWLAKFSFIRRLKKMKIDKAFLFHPSSTRARITRWAGARERIGYNTKGRRSSLTCAVEEQEGPIHDVQYFLDLLSAAGLRVTGSYTYEFYFSRSDELWADSILNQYHLQPDKLVAVNPGANWAPKRWPVTYYRELVIRLIHDYDAQVVLTGDREDESIARAMMNHSADFPIISLCGKTNLCELGAFFSKCRLVISNDSGPLHIAAGVGTNVIGIFGPTAPRETAPMGRGRNVVVHYAPEGVTLPWIGRHFPYGDWMEHISVDDILNAIDKEKLLTRMGNDGAEFSSKPIGHHVK